MFIEAVAGLSLLATLTLILTTASGRHAATSRQNAAQLQAARLAATALNAAQHHLPPLPTAAGDSVRIGTLFRTSDGLEWIMVVAEHDGRSVQLTGPIVPGGQP